MPPGGSVGVQQEADGTSTRMIGGVGGCGRVWAGVGNNEEECRTPELVTAGADPPRPQGRGEPGNTAIEVAGTSVGGPSRLPSLP